MRKLPEGIYLYGPCAQNGSLSSVQWNDQEATKPSTQGDVMTTQQRIEIALRAGMVAHAALELARNQPEVFPLLFQRLEKEVSGLKDVLLAVNG